MNYIKSFTDRFVTYFEHANIDNIMTKDFSGIHTNMNLSTGGQNMKKGVLKNFAMFTGNHLRCSLLLTKLQAWRSATLVKRHSKIVVFLFLANIEKILRTTISKNTWEWLLLKILQELRRSVSLFYWASNLSFARMIVFYLTIYEDWFPSLQSITSLRMKFIKIFMIFNNYN